MNNAARRPGAWLVVAAALAGVASGAAAAPGGELGRLFYSPTERAQLEQARTRQAAPRASGVRTESAAPLRYDGAVIRSDGRSTHWVDGRAQPHAAEAGSLKPGQTRADGKVFEPYQVLRPAPAAPASPAPTREPAP